MSLLLHELVLASAQRSPDAEALRVDDTALGYGALAEAVRGAASALMALGLARHERVAVYLPKQAETVVALYGTAAAGLVFVPVNPVLRARQLGHILRDCGVRVLVTSRSRLEAALSELAISPALHTVVLVDGMPAHPPALPHVRLFDWPGFMALGEHRHQGHPCIDTDVAAILYTSGSTGTPKGVVLSHRNMVLGAQSVASYLENQSEDRLLAVLPLSFDYGLNQLSTAFLAGACVVLMDYLLPQDVIRQLERHRVTGLAAVPPLWTQLARLSWPSAVVDSLRYITNSGGRMPRAVTDSLRASLPKTRVFLMYGLTEAFRSTYLPPEELDRRPDSIGKAIPNAEVLVVREDGSRCPPGEPGELVHRGGLVALGYWNDPGRTAERFRPVPAPLDGLPLTEWSVWSGDTVRADEEGYLYFVGRRDEMIKTSGYRVSPTELEEVLYASGLVAEAAAFGITDAALGQAIVVVAQPASDCSEADLIAACRAELPAFMVPRRVVLVADPLPRNPNGKIDRRALSVQFAEAGSEVGS